MVQLPAYHLLALFYLPRSGMIMGWCRIIFFFMVMDFFITFGFSTWVILVFGSYEIGFINFHYYLKKKKAAWHGE